MFHKIKKVKALEDLIVEVDRGGYGISWSEEIDLGCNEIWEQGITK